MRKSVFDKLLEQAQEHAKIRSESETTGEGVCENVVVILEQNKTLCIRPIGWVYDSVFHMSELANNNRLTMRKSYSDQMMHPSLVNPLSMNYDSLRADVALSYIANILVGDFTSSLDYIFDSYGEREFIETIYEILNGIVRVALADLERIKNAKAINNSNLDTRAIQREMKLFTGLCDKINTNLGGKSSYRGMVDISVLQKEIDVLLET